MKGSVESVPRNSSGAVGRIHLHMRDCLRANVRKDLSSQIVGMEVVRIRISAYLIVEDWNEMANS